MTYDPTMELMTSHRHAVQDFMNDHESPSKTK